MKTTVNAIEMVKAAGIVNAGEIRLFLMETRVITVDVIKASLVELMVAVPTGRPKKIVLADLLARALEMEFAMESEDFLNEVHSMREPVAVSAGIADGALSVVAPAAGETPVAEEIKEVVVMANVISKEQKAANLRMLDKSKVTKGDMLQFIKGHGGYSNPAVKGMMDKVNHAKDQYMKSIGEYGVSVESINFYMTESEIEQALKDGEMSRAQARQLKSNREVVRVDKWERKFIGEVTIAIPQDFMVMKRWNAKKRNPRTGKLGMVDYIPFHSEEVAYDMNLAHRSYDMRSRLAQGSGLLVLPIREDKNGRPVVMLPKNGYTKDGKQYFSSYFRTADARFSKRKENADELLAVDKDAVIEEPLYLEDNNEMFNAMVSAMIQMYSNEYVQANPANNHAFNKSNSTHLISFQVRDGVMDDVLAESMTSRAVLDQADVQQLREVGPEQPRVYDPITNAWVDVEYVQAVNDFSRLESGVEGLDDKGNVRFGRQGEILISGCWVKKSVAREQMLEEAISDKHYFIGTWPKSNKQYNKELLAAKEAGETKPYIPKYIHQGVNAGKCAVQTLVEVKGNLQWVNAYPYEVLEDGLTPMDIRVKGAGMTVYAGEEIEIDATHEVPVEAYDERLASVMKNINYIMQASRNWYNLDEYDRQVIENIVKHKPEDLTADESRKWDNAVTCLEEAKEREAIRLAARNVAPFDTRFFAGEAGVVRKFIGENEDGRSVYFKRRANVQKVRVQDLFGEAMRNAEEGRLGFGLGYADLSGSDIVRYLDDSAMDLVYDAILTGASFVVVAEENNELHDAENVPVGTEVEEKLVAEALQSMLQQELTSNYYVFADGTSRDVSLVNNVRRDENPKQALANLKVCDEVRRYIGKLVGLNK